MSGEKTKNVVHMTYDKDGYPTWHTELSPEENTTRATCIVPPDTVIPVVFVPGIMGSNLKFKNNERPKSLQNDIAWRPDSMKYTAWTFGNLSPAKRREILNPGITELDDSGEIPNSIIRFFKNVSPNVQTNWKSEFKRRGWGGIMLSSYGEILCNLEWNLNRIYDQDCEVSSYWQKDIVGVKATVDSDGKNQHPWGEMTGFEALDMTDLKEKVGDKYWFPVHAAGYNWLCSNEEAGNKLADKIKAYIKNYKDLGFDCEKAIIVTHSMGGLAARAVCHPEMGKIADIVAGVVHGEQPAIGAAAAYKRMHAGFEARWWNIVEILTARALGWSGREVTAVLSNAPGGLELLPTKRYPAGWLKINNGGNSEMQLPESDPYKEIYAERDQWWRLMNPEWIEPQVPAASAEGLEEIWNKYLKRLAVAERFHDSLADYYHPITHTHYGADEKHKAWTTFTWKKNRYAQQEEPPLGIPPPMGDNALGTIRIETASELAEYHMTPPDENGDGTVPEVSGADSASKAKFAAKMTGYDHQGSYSYKAVKDVTIYSIARIAKDI